MQQPAGAQVVPPKISGSILRAFFGTRIDTYSLGNRCISLKSPAEQTNVRTAELSDLRVHFGEGPNGKYPPRSSR